MRVGKFQFKPRFAPTVVAIMLLPILLGLGFWQLERAEQKRVFVEQFQSRLADAPVRLDGNQRDGKALANRRVVVTGHYQPYHQVLLDNQIHRGRPGYHVLTPLAISGSETVVLVNRGWVPLGRTRAMLPDIRVPEADQSVQGQVYVPTGPPLKLGDSGDVAPGWPKVVQRIDFPALGQRLDATVLPYTVRLAPDQEHGYVRDWRAQYGASPEKHQAYAAQWFTLALVLFVVYVALSTRHVDSPPPRKGVP